MTAWPVLRIGPLALSMRYSVRLLSNSGVAGRVEVLGPLALEEPATEPDGVAVLVADREEDAGAELVVDAAAAALVRGEARPTSTSSSGRTSRLVASVRVIVSQPPGAQPSW